MRKIILLLLTLSIISKAFSQIGFVTLEVYGTHYGDYQWESIEINTLSVDSRSFTVNERPTSVTLQFVGEGSLRIYYGNNNSLSPYIKVGNITTISKNFESGLIPSGYSITITVTNVEYYSLTGMNAGKDGYKRT